MARQLDRTAVNNALAALYAYRGVFDNATLSTTRPRGSWNDETIGLADMAAIAYGYVPVDPNALAWADWFLENPDYFAGIAQVSRRDEFIEFGAAGSDLASWWY
jgi:hypothetical protein